MARRFTVDELEQIDQDFLELISATEWTYLLIDGSTAQRKILRNHLVKAGCAIILEAKDGVDALTSLKDVEGNVIAVVELNSSVMDGLQFMKEFRGKERFAKCPVIIMSAESRKDRIIAAIKGGASAYLKKPFSPEMLIEKLKSLKVL